MNLTLLNPATISQALYWIPLLPLLGAALIGLFGRRLGKGNVAVIACATVLGSALLAAVALLPMAMPSLSQVRPVPSLGDSLGTWFKAGSLTVEATLSLDHLGAVMALVVSGVSFLIHVYSVEYMADDPGFARYFAYLNLFVGFMLVLVLANDLVLMFVGWEGVGLCSYLLIGFWYEDDAKAYAGRKAFVVNRIGDFGFLLGLFVLFGMFGTFQINAGPGALGAHDLASAVRALLQEGALQTAIPSGPLAALGLTWGGAATLACLLLFVGATGKSAQFPLYVWLPDAMAGPTPVSALIHAATMVTAGVYMVARLSFLFGLAPMALAIVAAVGVFTALFAALMGTAQNDIKKVLAYSTVSQLGFMFMGVGLAGFWQGTYHLVTHAFFKACLFLGSGAVILGCHHEQDIRKMGGLRKRMPSTAWTFLIATFTIAGALPFSGFFSKDAILHHAHAAGLPGYEALGHAVYWIGTATAFVTSFYMFRLYFLVFEGEPRSEAASHARECKATVTAPLWILALLSIGALVWGVPGLVPSEPSATVFQWFTSAVFEQGRTALQATEGHEGILEAFAIALAVAWAGFGLAFWLYRLKGIERLAPLFQRQPGRAVYALVANKFYVDEIYDALIVGPFKAMAVLGWQIVDVFAIDTVAVRGTARLTGWVGTVLRYAQNGDVQRYAAVMVIAAVAVLWVLL